mmetsp:Transcript_2577/g.4657  ORF Transcript_2577/g.4657 Transcript_2577/m.4657 type:complete len:215 (-) Transcript_2577:334-978(-)
MDFSRYITQWGNGRASKSCSRHAGHHRSPSESRMAVSRLWADLSGRSSSCTGSGSWPLPASARQRPPSSSSASGEGVWPSSSSGLRHVWRMRWSWCRPPSRGTSSAQNCTKDGGLRSESRPLYVVFLSDAQCLGLSDGMKRQRRSSAFRGTSGNSRSIVSFFSGQLHRSAYRTTSRDGCANGCRSDGPAVSEQRSWCSSHGGATGTGFWARLAA